MGNGLESPYKSAPDSPSRQLLYELSQLAISVQKEFHDQLDRECDERERLHKKALATAAANHERVRKGVELERQRLNQQIQAERERRDADTRKEVETLRQQKVEREIEERRREVERAQAITAEEKRKEDLVRREREAAEARLAQQKADEANRVREQQDAEKRRVEQAKAAETRAKEAAIAAQKTRQTTGTSQPAKASATQIPAAALASTTITQPTINPQREAEHKTYVGIHQRLKQLRKHMTVKAKESPELKKTMGEMRREIKKCVGQLTEGKGSNRTPLSTILTTLRKAAATSTLLLPVSPFLANPPTPPPQNQQGPALLLYLLNIFAKAIIAQFIDEAGVSPKAADPVGIIASHVFAVNDFRWNGRSLIDILLAKMHVVCPVLFGIYGPEATEAGKQRLGWWREEAGGPFVAQQRHYERMTGLGAGFAALSLRNYEKAKLDNPFPDHQYWIALSTICNTPPAELTPTHFVVLKGLVENYESKFVMFFGGAAVAALRVACVELPMKAPGGGVAAKGVAGLVEVMKREKMITL